MATLATELDRAEALVSGRHTVLLRRLSVSARRRSRSLARSLPSEGARRVERGAGRRTGDKLLVLPLLPLLGKLLLALLLALSLSLPSSTGESWGSMTGAAHLAAARVCGSFGRVTSLARGSTGARSETGALPYVTVLLATYTGPSLGLVCRCSKSLTRRAAWSSSAGERRGERRSGDPVLHSRVGERPGDRRINGLVLVS